MRTYRNPKQITWRRSRKEKQEQIYNHNQRFHAHVWKEHEKLAKEIQEVQRGQMAQVAANKQRIMEEAFGAKNGLSEQETEFRSLAVQSSTPRHGNWRLSVHALGQNADIPRLGVEAYA
ncbi:hypothetical protein PIB30_101249 [Stylosanthes scabra]|uniref:Uncharacterized protein n=1 Tax=Stylosanthes scabra TaxID=79078 RepID=A0ABU6TWU1_9FABA|nr:hypothetical protein [Stylosanthes scabra]